LGQPREFKNSAIVLKFDTLVDWMNTWLTLFSIFQNLHFWVFGTLFVLNLWGSIENKILNLLVLLLTMSVVVNNEDVLNKFRTVVD